MPASTSKNLDKVINNVRPLRPTEDLQDELHHTTRNFMHQITKIITNHLNKTAREAQNNMAQLDDTDVGLVREVATRQNTHRFGSSGQTGYSGQYFPTPGWMDQTQKDHK